MAPSVESQIYDFLVMLYGTNEGVVYAPTKGATAKSFIRYYFNWPEQKAEIVQHMLQANKEGKDAWVAPALLKSNRSGKKENWLGTQYLYVDFDGNAPQTPPENLPEPTLRIQSSIPGREHWYWRLDHFFTGDDNRKVIEALNKSLTYSLDADKGGWDATQVMRAPGTKHRRQGTITRVLNHESSTEYSLEDFRNVLPAPPKDVRLKHEEKSLPDILEVLSRVNLKTDAREIFNRKKEEVPDRSVALFRFAAECLEYRPPIFKADILAMLNHLCYKWGKFEDREDRFVQVKIVLQNAIANHDPKKIDENPETEWEPEELRTIDELAEHIQRHPINWLVKGMLPEGSTMQIVGEANIGKTSLALRLCADLIIHKDFLRWKYGFPPRQPSVAYFGFDMDEGDAHDMLEGIKASMSPIEFETFKENFSIATPDYGIELWTSSVQERYEQFISASRATIVVFDSLKDTGALDGDDKRKAIYQWFKRKLRREMGLTVIVLSHTRKRDKDSKVHQTQDDIYGSGMQNADIKASLLLYKTDESGRVYVNQTKVRRAKKIPTFIIKRHDDRLEYVVVNEEADITEPSKNGGSSNGLAQAYTGSLFGRKKDDA